MSANTIVLERFDITKSYNGIKKFDCGHEMINRFATHSLKQNVKNSMCQAYVLVDTSQDDKFIAYYNIMAFSIAKEVFNTSPSGSTKQIPVLRLVMLGVDLSYAGQGLGSKLLKHSLELTLKLSSEAGIAGLYLDAEDGKHDFYRKRGFVGIKAADSTTNILPMFISVATIADAK
ncbi:MAG: GNAT family N-acetyltransferase [Sulfuricurvum sp.]|nr:GNAT family N-acetyltransferase [Sulfuricurvum sp.]